MAPPVGISLVAVYNVFCPDGVGNEVASAGSYRDNNLLLSMVDDSGQRGIKNKAVGRRCDLIPCAVILRSA